ncbi:protein argonaute [Physcia stellaris]|nr:protein argonaute [Physcia stellaris]
MQFSFVAAIALFASIALAYPYPVPVSDIARREPQTPSASDPSMIDANGNLVDFESSGVDTAYKSAGNSASGK